MSSSLESGGVRVTVPRGWEGRARAGGADGSTSAQAAGTSDESVLLHVGSFPLPATMGDYGSGAVERMGADDVLLCLLEHDASDTANALFRRRGVPQVRVQDFGANNLQRVVPGMSGAQWFFSVGDRAFCLYGVLGSHRSRAALAPRFAAVVDTLEIT